LKMGKYSLSSLLKVTDNQIFYQYLFKFQLLFE